ncbi:MAG: hypothetical protein KGP28_03930 [Bdellovibrionales bacterium]|nr:hypothetical protein [Bdellovibrionales bacterium]
MKTLSSILGLTFLALSIGACGTSAVPAFNQNGFNNNPWGPQTGPNPAGPGGCVPLQNGTIPFTVQGAAINGAVILGGMMPMNSLRPGTYGQAMIGNGGMTGGQGMIQYAPFQSSAGTIQITASQGGTQGGLVSGMINLSQTTLYQVLGLAANLGAYQNPQPPLPNQGFNNFNPNVCVSSLAVHIVHQALMTGFSGMGQIFSAQIYLYLNNSQMPIGPISFF